jgi:hypothetical protein
MRPVDGVVLQYCFAIPQRLFFRPIQVYNGYGGTSA